MTPDAAQLPQSSPKRSAVAWGRIVLWMLAGLLAIVLLGAAIAYAYPWLVTGEIGFPEGSAR